MTGFDIRLQRLIDVSPDTAFRHWVDADARRRWYAPDEGTEVIESEADVRVGGSYRTSVVGPTGEPMYTDEGVFEVVDPPHRIVYRGTMHVPDGSAITTRVSVTFEAHEGKTLLTLLDSGYPTEEQRDDFAAGWPSFLDAYERTLTQNSGGNDV
jgi:uncharacterized protein YndB with AHSA1/START domain